LVFWRVGNRQVSNVSDWRFETSGFTAGFPAAMICCVSDSERWMRGLQKKDSMN